MTRINRQWLLKQRPSGRLTDADFEYRETPAPERALAPGEILVQNMVFLCAPTMRNWMDPPSRSLYPSIPLGAPVMAPAAARVLASADARYPVGARVTTLGTWQDYEIIDVAKLPVRALPAGISFIEGMGRYGLNSMTGYFGVTEVGKPKAGETLVVSAAAGSTGSVAAQVGRLLGCRVIGIAGGPDKCRWLRETCRLDDAVDYKHEDVAARLAAACPKGIDIFFDNVGGDILQAAIDNMAPFGRIVLCGQIASYNDGRPAEGPRNMMRLIYGNITMQGFLNRAYADKFEQALADLKAWVASGELVVREDVREGFAELPRIYRTIFDGTNQGTLLAQIDAGATATA